MKKIILFIFILFIINPVYATTLNVYIPDQYAARIIEGICEAENYHENHLLWENVEWEPKFVCKAGTEKDPNCELVKNIFYDPDTPQLITETKIQFVKRMIKKYLKNTVKAYEDNRAVIIGELDID